MEYTYSSSSLIRDFSPIIETYKVKKPGATSIFKTQGVDPIDNTTFTYYDDIEQPVSAAINNGGGYNAGTSTFTVDSDVGDFAAGDVVTFLDSSYETLVVKSWNGSTSLVTTTNSAYAHADNVVIMRVGTPTAQGSGYLVAGNDITMRQGTPRTNYTSIIRYDVPIAASRLRIGDEAYNETVVQRGVMQMWEKAWRELNARLLFDKPVAAADGVIGRSAGIMHWLTASDAIKTDLSAAALTVKAIDDLNERILLKGGDANILMGNTQTSRMVSKLKSAITNNIVFITQDSEIAGNRAVSTFTPDIIGSGNKAFIPEQNLPDGVLLLMTQDELELVYYETLMESDTTPAGFHGVRRTLVGEIGTRIRNPNYAHGLLYNFTVSL